MKKNILVNILIAIVLCLLIFITTYSLQVLRNKMDKQQNKIKEIEIQIEDLKEKDKVTDAEIKEIRQQAKFTEKNLKMRSNVSTDQIEKVLADTKLSGLGESYVKAEEEYGVNAIALVALTAQESDWGKSGRAINDNNLSGYAVYDDESEGVKFDTKHDNILATAELLATDYLDEEGKHHIGEDLYSVNEVYCPNDDYHWASSIEKIGKDLEQKINNL